MKKNILFVINPISGGKSKKRVEQLIIDHLDHSMYEYEMAYSNAVDHARKLSKSAVHLGFDVIVAVGGDGTVNEVARGILSMGASATLGIVPYGSGNGLARHLQIPMDVEKAIQILNQNEIKIIDSAVLNDIPFFNVAGMGFDAHISAMFANNKKRGLSGYIKSVFQELKNYKPVNYNLSIDGKVINRDAFMVSFANSTQFGNNAHIAPLANITDGLLDVTIVKPFASYQFPVLAWRLMNGTAHKSPYVEIIKGKEIQISRNKDEAVHLDGEPRFLAGTIDVKIVPASMKVLVPLNNNSK
ncbi:diacylglycerol/lipid kinase family protein [Solitalea lacus]|uniref:diacylglycerol/lipid kinase family protein n=1 Tax=Solitalea lacus TaxID=2911172 RepID=UPI001EDC3379|nr:diacylglycerol kinase family protein [Solitalea lacus]UKJ07730.1 diacylglycerol kinase family lipid kinase [Solitalea lacus]